MMRRRLALLLLMALPANAFALDTSSLPQACKDTLASLESDKPRFAELARTMAKFRKTPADPNFCNAARQTITLIKDQSGRLDECIGTLAGAQGVSAALSTQMMKMKSVYREMIDASNDSRNDHLHCGLASQ